MLARLTDERKGTDAGLYERLGRIADCINGLPEGTTLRFLSDAAPPGEDGAPGFTCRGLREGCNVPVWECMEYSVECYLTVDYGLDGLAASTWGLNRFPNGSPGITIKAEDTETIHGWWPDGEPLRIEKGVIVDAD